MAQAIDLMLDDDGDLLYDADDLVMGYSDGQHIQHIFETEPGELKENVLLGIGIEKKINGPIDGDLRREATLQITADGYELNSPIIIKQDNVFVDAQRKD